MALLHRFGSADDFDPNKMLARELAYVNTTNATYKAGLYLCYAPGDVRRQTTEQDIIDILNTTPEAYSALQQLLTDLGNNPSELTNILNNITALQTGKLDKIGDSKDNTVTFMEAVTETDVVTGEKHSNIVGKVVKSIKTFRNAISVLTDLANGKIDKTSIVQTDTVNDTTKVPSSAVTYAHGQAITTLNNNLGSLRFAIISNLTLAIPIATTNNGQYYADISFDNPVGVIPKAVFVSWNQAFEFSYFNATSTSSLIKGRVSRGYQNWTSQISAIANFLIVY